MEKKISLYLANSYLYGVKMLDPEYLEIIAYLEPY